MTQNQQRFSGPELAALLAQVREQLGDDASILEANRLRQGGIGGFFSKERFEVVAVPADLEPAAAAPSGLLGPEVRIPATERGVGAHLDGLLDRAERVSSVERHTARLGGEPAPAALALDEAHRNDARFQQILETALADVDIDLDAEDLSPPPPIPASIPLRRVAGDRLLDVGQPEDELPPVPPAPPRPTAVADSVARPPIPPVPASAVVPVTPPPVPSPALARPASAPPPPAPAADPAPPAPVPPPAVADLAPPAPVPVAPPVPLAAAILTASAPPPGGRRPPPGHKPGTRDLAALPAGGFWSRLLRFEQLVDDSPLCGAITAIVGPLDDALAVARAVARANDVDPGDIVVISHRGSVADLPPWFVVRTGDEVAERVRYWRAARRDAVVVIDADPVDRLHLTRGALAAAAPDVTRLVVPTLDDTPALAAMVGAVGPVAALDLTRPPSAEQLLELVERGVRVATVCGRPLTPLLLAALAGPADRG